MTYFEFAERQSTTTCYSSEAWRLSTS